MNATEHRENILENTRENTWQFEVILFYKYVGIDDPEALFEREKAVCEVLELTGRIIVAKEGINVTLEGSKEAIAKYKAHIKQDRRFRDISIKGSQGTGKVFPRLSVKVKPEIVPTKLPAHIDPRKQTGKYLPPHELKRWYEEGKNFVVIDMRNSYEVASGYFEKTVNPNLKASRDLPKQIEKLRIYKDTTVVTVCTGGVRCEKMSAYLLDQGFKDVHQLENGMHGFMEKYPGEHFNGTLYTFDNRTTMHWGGERTIVGACTICKDQTEEYSNCKNPTCNAKMLVCEECVLHNQEKIFCQDNEVCGKNA